MRYGSALPTVHHMNYPLSNPAVWRIFLASPTHFFLFFNTTYTCVSTTPSCAP